MHLKNHLSDVIHRNMKLVLSGSHSKLNSFFLKERMMSRLLPICVPMCNTIERLRTIWLTTDVDLLFGGLLSEKKRRKDATTKNL